MKLINKILLGVGMIAAASLTSCEDGLTSPTQSSFDESVVFSNYTLAEYNVFGIYEVFGHTNCHRGRYLPWYGFNTDIELYNNTTADEKSSIARYSMTATNGQLNLANGPYNELMGGIERANLCIKGIRQYGNPQQDSQMAALLGEALCGRALLYTELLKAYGEVPARFEPISPETIYLNKSDKDVIYKQLLADLEEAFNYMAWPGQSAATMTTDRPSLAFAKGLYARLCLMASGESLRPDEGMVGTGNQGTVRLSTDPQLQKSVLYPKALAALKDVIENSGLSLYDSYEQLWRDQNNMDLAAGKEVIYVIPHSDTRGRWNYNFAIRTEGNPEWTQGPTSNRGGSVGPTPTLYWKYGKEDVRRDISCVNWKWTLGPDGKNIPALAGPNDWYFGKFRFEWQTNLPYNGGNDDGIKPVYMRYSDILLMAAEVANSSECGEKQDMAFAKKCLLEVRKRAYKGNESMAESYVNGLADEKAVFEAIVDERAFEFVGEMLRKQDLIRWGLLGENLEKAEKELKAWMDNAGTEFGPAVWYRYAADGSIETYGYNEKSETDLAPGEGWECYTNSKGEVATYFKFISEDTGTYSESAQRKLDSFYDNDPDTKQWWPIPEATLVNSQGALVNDYGF